MIEKLRFFYRTYFKRYTKLAYSQEGEDLLLSRIFGDEKKSGFYIDIGAHHPYRFSNTYWFYKLGWKGINIDPNPLAIKAFNFARKNDININLGISDTPGELTYYMFNDPALNTFDKELSIQRDNGFFQLVNTMFIQVIPLAELLDNLEIKEKIDFMSIDVEGFDLIVLKSNNWKKYRPKYLIIEILDKKISELTNDETYLFLQSVDYDIHSKLLHSFVFIDKTFNSIEKK